MRVTLPLLLSQLDSRWAGILLGNNSAPVYNIANDGCDLTDLAMISNYFGHNVYPSSADKTASLNDLLKGVGGFTQGGGDYVWGSISRVFSDIKENKTDTPDPLTDAQMGEIKSALDAGFPVIVQIDYNPPSSSFASHYVTIVDYNPGDEDDFTIADPLGGVNGKPVIHSLKNYLSSGWGSARKLINQYAIYQGPLQHVPTDSCLLPATDANKKTFTDLVHGSTQWDATVGKYMPGQDPKKTDFPALQQVVAGIQSTATASNNTNTKTQQDLASAQSDIASLTEQLANEEKQRQDDQTMYLAQIAALKGSAGNLNKIQGSYEGRITALTDQVKGLLKDKQDLSAKLAAAQVAAPKQSWIQKLLSLFQN